jgi:hypothetical protein
MDDRYIGGGNMILIVEESKRAYIEACYGTIINYKRYVYRLAAVDWSEVTVQFEAFKDQLVQALSVVGEQLTGLSKQIVETFKPLIEALSEIEWIDEPAAYPNKNSPRARPEPVTKLQMSYGSNIVRKPQQRARKHI